MPHRDSAEPVGAFSGLPARSSPPETLPIIKPRQHECSSLREGIVCVYFSFEDLFD
jgi:hypothetical protein